MLNAATRHGQDSVQKDVFSCVGSFVFVKPETKGRAMAGVSATVFSVLSTFQTNLFNTYSLCMVALAKALTSQVVSAVVVLEKASKQGCPKKLNFNVLRTAVFEKKNQGVTGHYFLFCAPLRKGHGHLISLHN